MYDIWKKEAINALELYEARKRALVNIPDQIKELEEKLSSIRSAASSNITVKGSGSGKDDTYINNIVAREKLSANLEEAKKHVFRVSSALDVLSNEEKEILCRFFVDQERGAADNIAEEKHIDRKTVYYRKDAALKKFAYAMYGGI